MDGEPFSCSLAAVSNNLPKFPAQTSLDTNCIQRWIAEIVQCIYRQREKLLVSMCAVFFVRLMKLMVEAKKAGQASGSSDQPEYACKHL